MGDRGVIRIFYSEGRGVELYTHWTGSSMHLDLQRALAKKWRWDDPTYLARIIFEEMIPESQRGVETGFGIGPLDSCDDSEAVIVVDVNNKIIAPKKGWKSYTFQEFIEEDFGERS